MRSSERNGNFQIWMIKKIKMEQEQHRHFSFNYYRWRSGALTSLARLYENNVEFVESRPPLLGRPWLNEKPNVHGHGVSRKKKKKKRKKYAVEWRVRFSFQVRKSWFTSVSLQRNKKRFFCHFHLCTVINSSIVCMLYRSLIGAEIFWK